MSSDSSKKKVRRRPNRRARGKRKSKQESTVSKSKDAVKSKESVKTKACVKTKETEVPKLINPEKVEKNSAKSHPIFVDGLPTDGLFKFNSYKSAKSSLPLKSIAKSSLCEEISQYQTLKCISKAEALGDQILLEKDVDRYLLSMAKKFSQYQEAYTQQLTKYRAKLDLIEIPKELKYDLKKWQKTQLKTSNKDSTTKKLSKNESKFLNLLENVTIKSLKPAQIQYLLQVMEKQTEAIRIREDWILKNKVYPIPKSSSYNYVSHVIKKVSMRQTILFSVDIEAFEWNNDIVTEIGISIYDPRENYCAITPILRNYHLIVGESVFARNDEIVGDFKANYIAGESILMTLKNCLVFVQSLINFYMVPTSKAEKSWSRAFVGHNVMGDLNWLKDLGIVLPKIDHKTAAALPNVRSEPEHHKRHLNGKTKTDSSSSENSVGVSLYDTEHFYESLYGQFGKNLGKLLRLFKIPHSFLHNAGNDAYSTLQLLLKMADFNHRRAQNFDNLDAMRDRIIRLVETDKIITKNLPRNYVQGLTKTIEQQMLCFKSSQLVPTILSANAHNENKSAGDGANPYLAKTKNSSKKGDGYVHLQTEFEGIRYYDDVSQALKQTLILL